MTPDTTAFRRLTARAALASAVLLVSGHAAEAGERWRGLDIADALTDCQIEYDRDLYDYDRPKLLPILKDRTGGAIFSPYTRRIFLHDDDVEIEHMVAAKEAHYSGLCKQDANTRLAFASDLLNLTLAAKGVNRAKTACDASTWIPPENRCWFARRVVEVRRKYKMTIDREEADALDAILSSCEPDDEFMRRTVKPGADALDRWDADGSGQIECGELAEAGVATPIDTSHPAWPFVSDGDCNAWPAGSDGATERPAAARIPCQLGASAAHRSISPEVPPHARAVLALLAARPAAALPLKRKPRKLSCRQQRDRVAPAWLPC